MTACINQLPVGNHLFTTKCCLLFSCYCFSVFPSVGAVIGFMLGLFQLPVKECDDLYWKLGSDVFKQNVILGTMKMGWSHAFYDSEPWENILKSVSLFKMSQNKRLCLN